MSDDKKGLQNRSKDDDNLVEGAETTFPSEASEMQTANSSNAEELTDSAPEGILEEMPIGAVGGNQELPAGDTGSILPELESSAVGDNQEASTSSGSVPNVILGIEDVQQAFLSHVKNHSTQFETIKSNLREIIRELKETVLLNPENWALHERLRERINETYAFLDEIKEAMSAQELREQFMTFQMNQFFERRREAGETFQSATVKVGNVEGVDVLINPECRSSNAEENVAKSKIAMAFVGQMLQAERQRRNAAMAEESKMEVPAVGMEGDRPAEEPRVMEEAADANVAEVGDDDGMLPYPVAGKYSLALRAHQMYPDSSSEDSPPEEPEQYLQGAGENAARGMNVVQERMAEDPQDETSSDSPVEESSRQL